jgi:hypothetical protein
LPGPRKEARSPFRLERGAARPVYMTRKKLPAMKREPPKPFPSFTRK